MGKRVGIIYTSPSRHRQRSVQPTDKIGVLEFGMVLAVTFKRTLNQQPGGFIMKRIARDTVAGLIVFLSAMSAHAVPVLFEFASTVDKLVCQPSCPPNTIDGVAIGDTVMITVLADNGNGTLANQTWNRIDIISGRVTAGTYEANYSSASFDFADPFFQTDALGLVSLSNEIFCCTGVGGTDSLGGDFVFQLFNAQTTSGTDSFEWDGNTSIASSWTVSLVTSVPEPSTLILFCAGLLGLWFVRQGQAS